MNVQEQEEQDFHVASDSDWDRAAAYELGAADRQRAWVLTDRDVWHRNPFYQGPPVPHPEDDQDLDAGDVRAVIERYDDDEIPF